MSVVMYLGAKSNLFKINTTCHPKTNLDDLILVFDSIIIYRYVHPRCLVV